MTLDPMCEKCGIRSAAISVDNWILKCRKEHRLPTFDDLLHWDVVLDYALHYPSYEQEKEEDK